MTQAVRFVVIVAAAASVALPARAAYVPVFGGPTYDPATGNGVQSFPYPLYLKGGFSIDGSTASVLSARYVNGSRVGESSIKLTPSGTSVFAALGTSPTGFSSSYARYVSDTISVGTSTKYVGSISQGTRGVIWTSPTAMPTELAYTGVAGGMGRVEVVGVANNGTIIGYEWEADQPVESNQSTTVMNPRPVRWSADGQTVTPLGTLGTNSAGNSFAVPTFVTATGTAFGFAYEYPSEGPANAYAVRWDAGSTTATRLRTIGNVEYSPSSPRVAAANSSNVSVGRSTSWSAQKEVSQGTYATRWNADGTADALQRLASTGYANDYAWDINSAGTIVGQSSIASGGMRAVRWDAGGTAVTPLGELTTVGIGGGSWAHDINDAGYAVGTQNPDGTYSRSVAVLWLPDGPAVDMNTLINPASGWTLLQANAISETNWVTGAGLFDPDGTGPMAAYGRAFLIQVPEPAIMSVVALAAAGLVRRKRAR